MLNIPTFVIQFLTGRCKGSTISCLKKWVYHNESNWISYTDRHMMEILKLD
jgi:hypothetical protein